MFCATTLQQCLNDPGCVQPSDSEYAKVGNELQTMVLDNVSAIAQHDSTIFWTDQEAKHGMRIQAQRQ